MFNVVISTAQVITGYVNLEWLNPILEKDKQA